MLLSLTIKNFGLIDHLSLEFNGGLNVLTGETGAGKSIIIGALRAVLGDRISVSQLRDPALPCLIEATFEIHNKELAETELLADFFSGSERSLIIQRTYLPDGRNKIKINGLNVTIAQLKQIGDHLIDFHGPHDHQMLLSPDSHRGMLDRLVDFGALREEYRSVFQNTRDIQKKIDDLAALVQSREREMDLMAHQLKELEQVALDEQVYEDLVRTQDKIDNAQKLNALAVQVTELFDAEDRGITEAVRQCFAPLKSLNQIDPQTQELLTCLEQIQENSEQLLSDLHEYARGLSFDPQEAQEVSARIDAYDNVRKKFGPSLDDAKRFYQDIRAKYDLLVDFEHNDLELRKSMASLQIQLKQAAGKITKKRKKAADVLKETIEKELVELGIAKVAFEARVVAGQYGPDGQDDVTFYISPNAGEALKPLAQIVSSGEAARVMLALKKALIKVDPIPVLIFDEIDAQIGGRLGTVTGKKLREISKNRQVLLITHLPQIASFADVHFKVNKVVREGRALTQVDLLDPTQRVAEIAQMMGGDRQSSISVAHAHDMLAKANS